MINLTLRNIKEKIWKIFSGKWSDSRSTQEIIDDIYDHRTLGREIDL